MLGFWMACSNFFYGASPKNIFFGQYVKIHGGSNIYPFKYTYIEGNNMQSVYVNFGLLWNNNFIEPSRQDNIRVYDGI